jgi:hypothetical protein
MDNKKHFLTRYSVAAVILACALYVEIFSSMGAQDGFGALVVCALVFIAWVAFLIIEMIVLFVTKKTQLAKQNLGVIGVLIVTIVFILIVGTIYSK